MVGIRRNPLHAYNTEHCSSQISFGDFCVELRSSESKCTKGEYILVAGYPQVGSLTKGKCYGRLSLLTNFTCSQKKCGYLKDILQQGGALHALMALLRCHMTEKYDAQPHH